MSLLQSDKARGWAAGPRTCGCAFRGASSRRSMVFVPGGDFLMGSNEFYREERPMHPASVEPFWMDAHPVTNAEFEQFIEATGYVTFSERAPNPAAYPDADPALLVPGSLVFTPPPHRVSLRDYRAWWAYVPAACWRRPEGPNSSILQRMDHPVVHVTLEDACAYAAWAGKTLPTEAEWEFAGRGGLEGATYPWGNEFAPDGQRMANIWHGEFPWQSFKDPDAARTTPVRSFPANGYGLYDVVGNVWEWTSSPYDRAAASCCSGGAPDSAQQRITVKGGSHLCAPNYCLRYRPAARQGQTPDTSTSHIGFRCIAREGTS